MEKSERQKAIDNCTNWWWCDNIINHEGEFGLLHMGFPRVFILIRNEEDVFRCSFEEFANSFAEVNYLTPEERNEEDTERLLIDAWNFMALQEEKEEDLAVDREIEESEEDFDF